MMAPPSSCAEYAPEEHLRKRKTLSSGAQSKRDRRERAEADRREVLRHRTRIRIGAAVGVLAVVGALIVLVVLQQTGPTNHEPAGQGVRGPALDVAGLPGLQVGSPPWEPEYDQLSDRLATLELPPTGNESFHIHAHLAVYVDGEPVTVPANIGFRDFEVPMHTHDTRGVIHIEAAQPSPSFTLGAIFIVWGVKFTDTELGGYQAGNGKTVHVYVNGKKITDPASYVLRPHDDVVIGYGTADSFPHTSGFTWPAGE